MNKKLEQAFKKVTQELKSKKFDHWEFRRKTHYEYFLSNDIYSLIGNDFSDADGYIFLNRKIEVQAYIWEHDEYFTMSCDRIVFSNIAGEPFLTDDTLYYAVGIDEELLSLIDSRYISLIKNGINRLNPVENAYWRIMKIMHAIRVDKKIPAPNKKKKMKEAFSKMVCYEMKNKVNADLKLDNNKTSKKIGRPKGKEPNIKELQLVKKEVKPEMEEAKKIIKAAVRKQTIDPYKNTELEMILIVHFLKC